MSRQLRVSPREQTLALATVVIVCVSAATSRFGLPKLDRLSQLEQQEDVAQRKLARLRELAARQSQIERAYQSSASFRAREPDEVMLAAFLDELEQLARAKTVQMNLKPRPIRREGVLVRLGVELELDGTQEALLGFLDSLFAGPNLIELERLRIGPSPSKGLPLRATLLVNEVGVVESQHESI